MNREKEENKKRMLEAAGKLIAWLLKRVFKKWPMN
jgi:hypothetical protein